VGAAGYRIFEYRLSGGSSLNMWLDGRGEYTATVTTAAPDGSGAFIGGDGADAENWHGALTEMIVYADALNSAQRILVENYLAARYNLTLQGDNYYNSTTHTLNVAGIGQALDGSNTEAHSAGIIISANSGFLQDDGDFMMFGHRAAGNDNTTDDLPTGGDWAAGNSQRWQRVWYLSKHDAGDNGGEVTIAFDFSEGGMGQGGASPAGDPGNYRLLERAGAEGQFTDITGVSGATASISGDRVIFGGVDSAELGSYYTLGTVNQEGSPTAVTLGAFTVQSESIGKGVSVLLLSLMAAMVGFAVIWQKKQVVVKDTPSAPNTPHVLQKQARGFGKHGPGCE